jgi:hypothetical protein
MAASPRPTDTPQHSELRRHVTDVLDTFVKCREWPDFIHSIETLKNVLQKHSELSHVPEKVAIAKVLAQGCTSATDSVHMKSLELYEMIFVRIGEEQLAADLALYSLGVFPLFEHASAAARLKIVSIVATFLVPLGPQLIPSLPGLLSALLPGLDDVHNQQVYSAVTTQFEAIETRISVSHFYRAVWQSMLLSPRVRLGGLRLFEHARVFNEHIKRTSDLDAEARNASVDSACLPDAARLVIKCLCCCLDDERLAIKMAAAKLVSRAFPLQYCSTTFRDVDNPDSLVATVRLVQSMLLLLNGESGVDGAIVLNWITGGSEDTEGRPKADAPPCATQTAVLDAMETMLLKTPDTRAMATWPYTILSKLVSNEVICAWVVPCIAATLVCSVGVGDPVEDVVSIRDRVQAATLVIEKVDPCAVWKALQYNFESLDAEGRDILGDLQSMGAAVKFLPLSDAETQTVYLPVVFCRAVSQLQRETSADRLAILHQLVLFCHQVLRSMDIDINQCGQELLNHLHTAFLKCQNHFVRMTHEFVSSANMWARSQDAQRDATDMSSCDTTDPAQLRAVVTASCEFMGELLHEGFVIVGMDRPDALRGFPKYPYSSEIDVDDGQWRVRCSLELEKILPQWFLALLHCCEADDSSIAYGCVQALFGVLINEDKSGNLLMGRKTRAKILNETIHGEAVALQLWSFLPPLQPMNCIAADDAHRYTAAGRGVSGNAAVQLWKTMYDLSPSVCSKVLQDSLLGLYSVDERVDHFKRYAYLWSTSSSSSGDFKVSLVSGLFPVLDALADRMVTVRLIAKSWLQQAFSTINRVLNPLFDILLHDSTARDHSFTYKKRFDTGKALYIWEKMASMVDCRALDFVVRASEATIDSEVKLQWNKLEACRIDSSDADSAAEPESYLDLCACTALRFAQGNYIRTDRGTSNAATDHECYNGQWTMDATEADNENTGVRATAVEYLARLFDACGQGSERLAQQLSKKLMVPCLSLLLDCVKNDDEVMQLQLLNLVLRLTASNETFQQRGSVFGDVLTFPTQFGTASRGATAVDNSHSTALLGSLLAGLSHEHHAGSSLGSVWVNFISECLPLLHTHLPAVARALLILFSELIPVEAQKCMCAPMAGHNAETSSFCHSPQLLVKLRGLVSVITHCLDAVESSAGDPTSAPVSPSNMFSGLMSSVSNVFGSELVNVSPTSPLAEASMVLYQEMHEITVAAVAAWGPPCQTTLTFEPVSIVVPTSDPSAANPRAAIQQDLLTVMSRMLKSRPREFTAGMIDWWAKESDTNRKRSLIELLHSIEGLPADKIVTAACDVLAYMYGRARNPSDTTDPALAVLEQPVSFVEPTWAAFIFTYIATCPNQRVEALPQAWPSVLRLSNDSLHTGLKAHHSPIPVALYLLRLLESFVRRCPPLSGKQNRKGLQDLAQRLVGQCITIMQQNFDLGAAAKAASPAVLHAAMERALKATHELELDHDVLQATIVPTNGAEVEEKYDINLIALGRCLSLVSLRLLENLLHPLFCNVWSDDKELLVSTLSGFVPPIISQLRNRDPTYARHAEACTQLIASFASNSQTLALWRKDVLDLFLDPDFFRCNRTTLSNWRVILGALLESDPDLFRVIVEKGAGSAGLLGRLNSNDTVHRTRVLKRLSFLLLSGVPDQYLFAMPIILEQLVEAIKVANEVGAAPKGSTDSAIAIWTEVFLCMRVLVVRMSADKLTLFWPIVVAEMARILGAVTEFSPGVVFGVFKLLDLLILLQPAAFHTHQWMFVLGCEEVLALPDSNSEVVIELGRDGKPQGYTSLEREQDEASPDTSVRRPLFGSNLKAGELQELIDLRPFAFRLKARAYESTVSMDPVDYEFIEQYLGADFASFDDESADL